jgi:hypothetical protein
VTKKDVPAKRSAVKKQQNDKWGDYEGKRPKQATSAYLFYSI